ncbi:MAG: hypothetical protein LWX70_12965, partial [Sphingobacteriia bacterium]|nr:hypothetical protein [Sphingobacteriia bacterium]
KIKDIEYILLVQPCNLAIRANINELGKRAYDYDKGILVPLKLGSKDKLKSPSNEQIYLPGLIDDIKYADFANFKIIPLDLLDLVIFQSNGEAVLDMNINEIKNDLIHFPWLKRYQYIHKEFIKFEKALVSFKALSDKNQKDISIKTLRPYIYAPDCLKNLKIQGSDIFNFKTRIFRFNIKRIYHYNSPYSDDLLQRFMQYLSRNAFEHDFSNNSL